MDKKLILAVAGSGKTRLIIDSINPDASNIIVGYTIANIEAIKNRLIAKFGFIPKRTKVLPFFTFLYTYCYRPILSGKLKTKGLIFERPPFKGPKRGKREYYITRNGYIYHSRLALLLIDNSSLEQVHARIDKFTDNLFIDEVQDFASHDFDFLISLAQLSIPVIAVGDYFQHTFRTSADGGKRKNLHSTLDNFKSEFSKNKWIVDTDTLKDSFRCSPTVCRFISENLQIGIGSHRQDETEIIIIDNNYDAQQVYWNGSVVKLFYKQYKDYNCFSNNWGLSKGIDSYSDVCIVVTASIEKSLNTGDFSPIAGQTLNKFYVACTRARGDLYFMSNKLLKYARNDMPRAMD